MNMMIIHKIPRFTGSGKHELSKLTTSCNDVRMYTHAHTHTHTYTHTRVYKFIVRSLFMRHELADSSHNINFIFVVYTSKLIPNII